LNPPPNADIADIRLNHSFTFLANNAGLPRKGLPTRLPFLIGVFSLACTAAHATAPKWVRLVNSGGVMAFVDQGSIRPGSGADKLRLTARTLYVVYPGDTTPSGPLAYSVQETDYDCVKRNTTELRTEIYDVAGNLLAEAKGDGTSREADNDQIFGGIFDRLCSTPLALPDRVFDGTPTAVAFARKELARLNPRSLAVLAGAATKSTDVDLSGLPDSASIELTERPPNFYLYTLYRSQAGRLVFYGQDKTNNVFTVQFRQPGVAQPLAVLSDHDYAGLKEKIKELGLTEIKPYDRVWFENGASFSMAPYNFWGERCHHPYVASFRVKRPNGKVDGWKIFKKWPKIATTVAYCEPRGPAHVTYEYNDFYPEIYQFSPGRIYLKLPGEPVLVRFNADGTTNFPKHRDDIIFVPASRIESEWKTVTDNGPAQQAAVTAADIAIREFGAMQINAR
jgi:hypothetical protein